MIAAALPAAPASAEPVAPVCAVKVVPFAAMIDAMPAEAASELTADSPAKSDSAAEPVADGTAPVQPSAPAIVADASALIAQLCPPPPTAPASVDPSTPACHARESGNPTRAAELDPRGRGTDTAVEGRASPRTVKPAKQAGKAAIAFPETVADPAPKAAQAPAPAAVQSVRAADAPAPLDPLAAAPLADLAVTHHLDLAHDTQWLDRLAQDIARSADQNANLRFSLSPEHLGRLTVDLAANADGTSIRLTTESEQAHRIVTDAQPRLVAEARAQGLRISETQVDLDQRQSGQQPQQSPRGQPGQDRARPAVLWTEMPQRMRAAATGVPAARDLYA